MGSVGKGVSGGDRRAELESRAGTDMKSMYEYIRNNPEAKAHTNELLNQGMDFDDAVTLSYVTFNKSSKESGESIANNIQSLQDRVVQNMMDKGASRSDASTETFNLINAIGNGDVSPESAMSYGLTRKEIEAITVGRQIIAIENYLAGSDKRRIIDPLGNLVTQRRRSRTEQNMFGSFADLGQKGIRKKLEELRKRYSELSK